MFSRTDRSALSTWWWTVDKPLLTALVALMFGGLVLSLAGSPPVADKLGLEPFHFVKRHAFFLVIALSALIGTSLLDVRTIRRLAIAVFVVGVFLMVVTLFAGFEIKGARRWLNVGVFALQPSEFVKPAFAVIIAWLFAEADRRPDMPAHIIAVALAGLVVGLLVLQPDFGQTMLIVLVWGTVFFAAGMSWRWIIGLGVLGVGGIIAAYSAVPHVRGRIDRFLNPESHDTYQTDTAIEAFLRGGWLGQGPGEGVVKRALPDSHTDFVFAVAGEEFGIVVCMLIAFVFAFIVLRGLSFAMNEEDGFKRLAVAGLSVNFGLQALINMSVNLQLIPPKGMTLPFVSYGGSSLIAVALGMGMLLALTRRRPEDSVAMRGRGLRMQAYPV